MQFFYTTFAFLQYKMIPWIWVFLCIVFVCGSLQTSHTVFREADLWQSFHSLRVAKASFPITEIITASKSTNRTVQTIIQNLNVIQKLKNEKQHALDTWFKYYNPKNVTQYWDYNWTRALLEASMIPQSNPLCIPFENKIRIMDRDITSSWKPCDCVEIIYDYEGAKYIQTHFPKPCRISPVQRLMNCVLRCLLQS